MSAERVRYLVISQRDTAQAEPDSVPESLLGRMQLAFELRELLSHALRVAEQGLGLK